MTAEAWVAVGFGAAGLALTVGALLVGHGVFKGTVAALASRVAALEGEMNALAALKSDVARIDERTKSMSSGIESILNSWLLREPPAYGPPEPPRARSRRQS